MIDQAKIILKNVFGYDEFISLQAEIIENVLIKNDTLVVMPTGGGKSLCYQIPALIFKGLTIVVSPLISLMKDQVEQLTTLGIKAAFLNSSLSYDEYERNIERIKRNEIKLLYLAPESILKQKILSLLSTVNIACITIDEAHCISEWGHDFRPEYRQLVEIRSMFPDAVCIALTATATSRVQEDIKNNLRFETSNEYIASFDRKNLYVQVIHKNNPFSQTVEFLKKFPDQSGIIYCFSRRQVDELYQALENEGFSVKPYHAGLSETERMENQELFIRDDVQIVVATIAFGMGINKPNVRFVVHYDLPKNIETYYQEIGRAGRDGLNAHCLLLLSYGDIQKVKYFINQKEGHEKRIANIQLNALLQFAETDVCRRIPLLKYFGENYSAGKCSMCDNCSTKEKQLIDITTYAQMFLSCIKRTGEIFGTNHVIDVLRGSESQKVLKFKHQKLSTYGIGKDYSKKQWFMMSRQFIQKGLIIQDEKFGSLKLTKKAYDVLKSREKVLGTFEEERTDYEQKKESEQEYDRLLFEIFRIKRKELADQIDVPPYVIFPDKTLIEMASFFPQSRESLLEIHGVGLTKLEKYGQIFLDIIAEYCNKHQIEERPKRIKKTLPNISYPMHKPRHILIGETFNAGKSIEIIMEKFGIKKDTVLNHLYKYLQEGHSLRSDNLLAYSTISPDYRKIVMEAFNKLGAEFLKPVFETLKGEISYEELKILRLYFLTTD